jgi:hypothetical protein
MVWRLHPIDEGGGRGPPRTGRVDAEVGLGGSFPADPS